MENNNQNNQQKKNNNKKRHNRHFNKRKPKNNESNVQELEAAEVLEDVENESFENDEENLEFLEDMFPEESVEAKPAPVKDENEEQVEVVGVRFKKVGKVYFFAPEGVQEKTLLLCHLDRNLHEIRKEGCTAKRTTASAKTTDKLCLIAYTNLTKLNSCSENSRKVLNELTEVNSACGCEIEEKLAVVKGILSINELHIKLVLGNLT